MRPFVVAAVLAAAFPGTALGAGLVQQRDLQPRASVRTLTTGNFELVGLHWRGSGRVEYRTRSLAGRWSRWLLSNDEDALPDRGTGELRSMRGWRVGDPQWTGASNAIQYRSLGRVSRVRAFLVRSPRLPVGSKRVELAGAPPIITRADWHADESIRRGAPFYAGGIHLAIVHHTAGSNSYTKAQSASIARAIELYHVQGNGWNDIGYNFLVDKYGQIFEGRYGGITRPVVGAHAQGFNSGSVGISLIGDYSSTSISPAARAALASLIAWRLDLAHIDPLSKVVRVSSGNPRYPAGTAITLNVISAHRDVYPTSCPGAGLYAQLPSLRTEVSKAGLPKLYAPGVVGTLGGPIRFTARLSNVVTWTVTVRDEAGATAASGTGTGTKVDWTWDATAATKQRYTWSITAAQMRPATGSIGSAPVPLSLQKLKLAPTIVSPNGDGRGDEAKASYVLSAAATVTAKVTDSLDHPVATIFDGAGRDRRWPVPADADRRRRRQAGTDLDALLGRSHARCDGRECAGLLTTAQAAWAHVHAGQRGSCRGSRAPQLGSRRDAARSRPRPWHATPELERERAAGRPLHRGGRRGRFAVDGHAARRRADRPQGAHSSAGLAPVGHRSRLGAGNAGGRGERPLAQADGAEGGARAGAAHGTRSRADGLRVRPGRQQEPGRQRAPLSQSS
jgi:hypothetical protein